MGNYVIDQKAVDQIHAFFNKAIKNASSSDDPGKENEFIPANQVKKIKAEISRLKIILRECRPDESEYYQEMLDFLQSKIKS